MSDVGDYMVQFREATNEWVVMGKDANRASKTYSKKIRAVRVGKRLANENDVSVEIYTRDGRLQETQHLGTTDRAKQR